MENIKKIKLGDEGAEYNIKDEIARYSCYPVGSVIDFVGQEVPDENDGWLFCDGRALSRSTYSDLFDVIGTIWGDGDGSTTFNIPDLRNRFGAAQSASIGTTWNDGVHTHSYGFYMGNFWGELAGENTSYIGVGSAGTQTVWGTYPASLGVKLHSGVGNGYRGATNVQFQHSYGNTTYVDLKPPFISAIPLIKVFL